MDWLLALAWAAVLVLGVVLGWHLRGRHERRVMLRQARQLADMVLREKRSIARPRERVVVRLHPRTPSSN